MQVGNIMESTVKAAEISAAEWEERVELAIAYRLFD